MKPIGLNDIKDILEYEKIRQGYRKKIIEMKKNRRIKLGDRITLTFENRYTVAFQIEEMIRIERIVDPQKIEAEIDSYNELIPGKNELSATLFVEVEEQDQIKPVLDSLVGLNKDSVFIEIGSRKIPAVFEEGHATDDRISAVQYVRFKLSAEDVRAIGDPSVRVKVTANHENYSATTELSQDMLASLRKDFAEDDAVNVWSLQN